MTSEFPFLLFAFLFSVLPFIPICMHARRKISTNLNETLPVHVFCLRIRGHGAAFLFFPFWSELTALAPASETETQGKQAIMRVIICNLSVAVVLVFDVFSYRLLSHFRIS
jgi:hypothetical protein